MQSDKRKDLASLASIPLIVTLGSSMLIPVLPELQRKLHVSSLQISLVITMYSIVGIFLTPVAGYLSDRFGRKKIILPALAISGIGGLISGLSAWWVQDSYWLILAGRFVQGLGATGGIPIVIALVGDMFKKEDDVSQGLGIIETANTFGKVASPILGSALAVVTWFLPFLAIPVFCAVSIVLVSFFVHAPKRSNEEPATTFGDFMKSVRDVFRQEGRWLFAVFANGGLCMFVIFGTMFYLSDKLEDDFGIHGIIKGLILGIPQLFLCVTSFITGKRISDSKTVMKRLVFVGCVAQAGGTAAAAFFANVYLLVGALVVAAIGIGLVLPCLDSLIAEGIEKTERGTVTSFYASFRFIGIAVGPPAVSLLTKVSQLAVFFSISALCLASAIYVLVAIRPSKNAGGGGPHRITSPRRRSGQSPA